MNQTAWTTPFALTLVLVSGCVPAAPPGPQERSEQPRESRGPADDSAGQRPARVPSPDGPPEVSFDTERDGRLAKFVGEKSGGMVRKVAVGIERKGVMRVQIDEGVSPEDTLPLTKSLLQGARTDFPDKPFTLAVYDPHGEQVLKAHYHPDQGVRYEVARGGGAEAREGKAGDGHPAPAAPPGGTTDKDRRFAQWAMTKGNKYLRYVEADLEHRGRLWFGVTRAVAPDDVSALTKSILQGARTEFPRRELTATVFDPEGEKIGKATLSRDGDVHWSR